MNPPAPRSASTQIYLDYSATAPIRPEVLQSVWPVFTETFGNPSSQHETGMAARDRLDWARDAVARVVGCASEEIIFTSGGTESDNLAVIGATLASSRGKHVVVSAVEHPAVLESVAFLERRHGVRVTRVAVDEFGVIRLDELERALTDETALCSVMTANNEVGSLQPLRTIAAMCAERGVAFHTDAVQAAGWLNLRELVSPEDATNGTGIPSVDALSLSGHKMGAQKGVGVLYRSARLQLEPTMHGGGQQWGLRSGTQDVAGPVGLAVALSLAERDRQLALEQAGDSAQGIVDPVATRRDEFIATVLDRVPDAQLTGHATERLPGHASFVFPRVNGETLLLELDRRGFACSSGSACAAGSQDPSPVLLAMGFDPAVAHTSVRFSFSRETSADDLALAAEALAAAHAALASR